MPHFRIEYSSNLETKINMVDFCVTINKAIMAAGIFELGAVRVRAFKADHVSIADDMVENSFIDMNFRVGKGRSVEQLQGAGKIILVAAEGFLVDLFKTPHFALSFSIDEINDQLSWKNNVIHARLRGK